MSSLCEASLGSDQRSRDQHAHGHCQRISCCTKWRRRRMVVQSFCPPMLNWYVETLSSGPRPIRQCGGSAGKGDKQTACPQEEPSPTPGEAWRVDFQRLSRSCSFGVGPARKCFNFFEEGYLIARKALQPSLRHASCLGREEVKHRYLLPARRPFVSLQQGSAFAARK